MGLGPRVGDQRLDDCQHPGRTTHGPLRHTCIWTSLISASSVIDCLIWLRTIRHHPTSCITNDWSITCGRPATVKRGNLRTSSNHHVGIRVDDLERAERFYESAFGATRMMHPYTISGEVAEMVINGPSGTEVQILPIAFPGSGRHQVLAGGPHDG
jgi:hypothetical protein